MSYELISLDLESCSGRAPESRCLDCLDDAFNVCRKFEPSPEAGPCPLLADIVAKVFLRGGTQILAPVGAAIE